MSSTRKCEVCGAVIPRERLEVLPNAVTCVNHSDSKKVMGFAVFPHKTGSEVMLVNPDDEEAVRQAERANRRAR